MALYGAFQKVTTGNVRTTIDSSTSPANALPKNPLGTIYSPPINAGATVVAGTGAPPIYKYVQYASTTNPAVVAAPAPVYYTDETFTIVSGNAAEAYSTTGGACIAGYLMPNSTDYSGLTNAILNNNWVWIQIGGFLLGAYAPTTVTAGGIGNPITGATTGNWTSIVNTTAAASSRIVGIQWKAIASSACDVLVSGYQAFWGS